MKTRLLFALVIFLCSCNNPYPDHKKLGGDVYVKLLALGEGDKEVCSSYQSVLSYKLGLLRNGYENFDYWNDYTFQNISAEALASDVLGENLCGMKEGDRSHFIFPYSSFIDSYLNDYASDSVQIADTAMLFLELKVLDLYTENEFSQMLEEKYQQGIIEENRFLKEYLSAQNIIDDYSLQEDVYWKIVNSTQGDKIKSGDHIAIDYVGSFLNGQEFDNTLLDSTSLYFDYGQSGQVIRAFEIVLSHMKEGERAILYVPSHKGFGKRGSTTGIVSENTPVRFELQVTEIYKSDSLSTDQEVQ